MKYILKNKDWRGDKKKLSLNEDNIFHATSSVLNVKLADSDSEAEISLSVQEVQELVLKLHEWLSERKADHGDGMNFSNIDALINLHVTASLLFNRATPTLDWQKEIIEKGILATDAFRMYFKFGNDYGLKR